MTRTPAINRTPWALASVLSLIALPSGAQEHALDAPQATHPEAFAVVNSVREMPDGRVMVADPLSRVFVVLSADLQRADTLGRLGGGPEEYRQPDAVWPLPGDSTLLVDLGNSRLTAVGPNGGFGPTRPIAQGEGGPMAPPAIAIPAGVDAAGHLYFQGMPGMSPSGPSDTVPILRLAPGGGPESVARVKTRSFSRTTSGGANEQNVSISPIPLSATDVWAVAPDGSVAIARVGPLRVDWVGADGSVRRGQAVEMTAVPIRQAEKEEWAADQESSGGGIAIQITEENGRRSMQMSRGGAGGGPNLDALTWPEAKAPWVSGSGRIDMAGRFWVRRSLPAGETALYDVFDRSGSPIGAVRLPEARWIVGFGDGVLYAVHVDAFDLKTLERYALPAM
ncbi:MAG: hypothetical protein HKN71_08015 [Gemmatimonadetes bacterium]|nr:hypothetical protein [Gemmatimonadota bacterium]